MKSPKNVLLIGRRMIRANKDILTKVLLSLNPKKLNIIYSKLEYINFLYKSNTYDI